MRLVMLGPPGAGKGTQAQILDRIYGAVQLSTGDILRRHRADGTALGREAQTFMDRGELVPDALIISMVESELTGKTSFILDGFPRTVPQAQALDDLLARLQLPLTAVVLFRASQDALIARLTARWVNPRTGRIYNTITNSPKSPGIDDEDGGPLEQRVDDQRETVQRRLDVYQAQTMPLIEYYEKQERLVEVDALESVDAVTASIVEKVGRRAEDATSDAPMSRDAASAGRSS